MSQNLLKWTLSKHFTDKGGCLFTIDMVQQCVGPHIQTSLNMKEMTHWKMLCGARKSQCHLETVWGHFPHVSSPQCPAFPRSDHSSPSLSGFFWHVLSEFSKLLWQIIYVCLMLKIKTNFLWDTTFLTFPMNLLFLLGIWNFSGRRKSCHTLNFAPGIHPTYQPTIFHVTLAFFQFILSSCQSIVHTHSNLYTQFPVTDYLRLFLVSPH